MRPIGVLFRLNLAYSDYLQDIKIQLLGKQITAKSTSSSFNGTEREANNYDSHLNNPEDFRERRVRFLLAGGAPSEQGAGSRTGGMSGEQDYFSYLRRENKGESRDVINAGRHNIQLKMMTKCQQFESVDFKCGERGSSYTECTESDDRQEENPSRYAKVELQTVRFYRVNLLDQSSLKRTSKLNRSAVGWIQTACFVKNYDLEVTVLSTAIYYAAASRGIDKARLELLLACAIWMAQKFCGSRSMTRGEALELASGKFSNKELALMESALFDILEHDLIVETVFQYVAQQRLAPEVESGVNFLLELLLLKDGKILFDEDKAHALIDLVEDPVRPSDTLEELRGILSWKQAELLRNKYLSSFEVDQLIKKLSK